MPASKAEQVLDALKALLETVPQPFLSSYGARSGRPGAIVDRNSVLPEKSRTAA